MRHMIKCGPWMYNSKKEMLRICIFLHTVGGGGNGGKQITFFPLKKNNEQETHLWPENWARE